MRHEVAILQPHQMEIIMTEREELLDLARDLAIGVETNDEETIWQCVLSMTGWVQSNGHLAFWGIEVEKNGVRQFVEGCWLRPDENVRQYIDRRQGNWDLDGVDKLLVFKDYVERWSVNDRLEPTFVVPMRKHVKWKVEGF